MNIAVYCGAKLGNKDIYTEKAKGLGSWIGTKGNSLVFGGGNTGLMGIIADSVFNHGGEAFGFMPHFLLE